MRRGQSAVPTILLTVMALIIWYVLWIYPQQRYELLFGEDETIPEQEETESVLFTTTVGEVGQSSGELLQTQTFKNLTVSYPLTLSRVAGYNSLVMSSSLLASENKVISLSQEGGKSYTLELNTNSIIGSPNIKVSLNNTILYHAEALSNSKTTIEISDSNINNYGEVLRITCEFNGVQVWTTQECGFDSITLYENVFVPMDLSDSEVFYLNPEAENAGLIDLSFNTIQANNYPVNLLINDESVYSGKFSNNETVMLSLEGENIFLTSDNNITLIAQQGARYSLSNMSMSFYSIPSGMAAKYVVFNLEDDVLDDRDSLSFEYEVTGIVEPGGLIFEILNTDSVYVVDYEELMLGSNELIVESSDLEETNNLKIYSGTGSNTGRLIIGELKIK